MGRSAYFRFGGLAYHSNSENTHNYSLYQKTRSPHSRLRWKFLLKPFASKRFTLASPSGDIFPLIKFSLFFWRNAVSWKWFIIFSLISPYVSHVILLPHGGVAKNIPQFMCLGIQLGQQLESMPPLLLLAATADCCKGKKSCCGVRLTFLSPRRNTCWHHHHPLEQKLWACYQVGASPLALGQTASLPGLWSSLLWRSKKPC